MLEYGETFIVGNLEALKRPEAHVPPEALRVARRMLSEFSDCDCPTGDEDE